MKERYQDRWGINMFSDCFWRSKRDRYSYLTIKKKASKLPLCLNLPYCCVLNLLLLLFLTATITAYTRKFWGLKHPIKRIIFYLQWLYFILKGNIFLHYSCKTISNSLIFYCSYYRFLATLLSFVSVAILLQISKILN